ncbi:MAG: flagellar export protein FliJ [Magnetospirillum sp. WYHS-4]
MAKGDLHNLIRLHEWQVDEKRRRLGELLRVLDDLEARLKRLETELIEEQRIAARAPNEAGFLYGNYAEAVIERRERLKESIARAEVEIARARDDLREAFRDLKKYEIAQRNRDQKAAAELARKEQLVLDELGLQGYRQRLTAPA